MGTAAHSQPGSPTPATPATGTASTLLRGTTFCSTRSDRTIEMIAESATPSTRKGVDWMTIARKIVLHVENCGESRYGATNCPPKTTTSSTTATTSIWPNAARGAF